MARVRLSIFPSTGVVAVTIEHCHYRASVIIKELSDISILASFFKNEVVLVMQFSEWLSFTASVSASVKSLAVRGSRSINYYAPP